MGRTPRKKKKATKWTTKWLEEYVRTTCLSEWEGCCCGLPKEHLGDHECAAETCDCTWTDEQSAAWWEEMKDEWNIKH